LEER
jgi:hypothetical protein